jgi:hypothetical protein
MRSVDIGFFLTMIFHGELEALGLPPAHSVSSFTWVDEALQAGEQKFCPSRLR